MIPHDKLLHYFYGQLIFAISYIPLTAFAVPYAFPIAFAIVAVIAAGKEIYDKVSGNGTPEFLDFLATILGTLAFLGNEI